MEFLPKEIEDIIIEYKIELEENEDMETFKYKIKNKINEVQHFIAWSPLRLALFKRQIIQWNGIFSNFKYPIYFLFILPVEIIMMPFLTCI